MNIVEKVIEAAGGIEGTCYPVSEALLYILGKNNWKSEVVHHQGSTHWYLRHRTTEEVLDATAEQYKIPPSYDEGRGCGFLTKNPSKRARIILEKIGYK